tara:strand:- start:265 stop:894 length:630 start_codon:yes stop_codon:yes gene_type:complete
MADPDFNPPPKDWGARTIKRFGVWLDKKMPTRASMAKNRYLKPIAHRFLRSDLWHFNRRSVPRGVALGMLAGFLIPLGGQTFVALFLALPIRANVPIAAVTTFITNPFTYPFWIAVAYQIGKQILQIEQGSSGQTVHEVVDTQFLSQVAQWLGWFGREAAVTFFGFAVLGVVFAALGYVISSFGWRWWIGRKRQSVLARRRAEQLSDGQ